MDVRKLLRRIHFLLNRRRLERELADEMAAHREMLPEERRQAFGGGMRLREDARDAWGWVWLDRLWQDSAYAMRTFRRSPGFTLGAVAVLARGVGANLAEFEILDASILHRLSVEGADKIFQFSRNSKERGRSGFTWEAVESYRAHCALCAFVVAENTGSDVMIDNTLRQRSNFVTGNYFSALRVLPMWGRLLDERDSEPGAPAVTVLGYVFWREAMGGDPHVINRMIHINGKPVQIVGVTPYDFDGLWARATAVWLPAGQSAVLLAGSGAARTDQQLFIRPKADSSMTAVAAEIAGLTREVALRQPALFGSGERISGDRLPGTGLRKGLNPAIYLLLSMVLLVLLSACANLANMLLARGMTRQREMEIRMALGAGRMRVMRQLLTENLLLAAMGSGTGLVAGFLSARFLLRALGAPPDIRVGIDWQIIVAALVFTAISTLAFGLAPALQLARGKHKSGRKRQVLVGVQVAVSCLLLIASALFARGAIRSATLTFAFDYERMLTVDPLLYTRKLSPVVARQKLDALKTRLEELPGAPEVAESCVPPFGRRYSVSRLQGLPPLHMNPVSPGYFAAMHIPVVRGRTFAAGEQNVLVVSESAARAAWAGEDPIGKALTIDSAVRTVVGVVRDSGANLTDSEPTVESYMPIDAAHTDQALLIVHARGDVGGIAREIAMLGAANGEPMEAETMRDARERRLDTERKLITVVGFLGLIATVLAAAGMFALMAFAVAQRTREIGIRMAIGAGPKDVMRALVAQNAKPVLVGAISGVGLGIVLGRVTHSLIPFQDNMLDPMGFAAGVAVFALIAVAATVMPAMKALRIDPASTLRCE
jgi:predicted permease